MPLAQFVNRIPNHGLQTIILRGLYKLRQGKNLVSFKKYANNKFFLYQIGNDFLPSESLGWFISKDYYRKCLTDIAAWGYYPMKVGDVVLDIGAGLGEEALIFSEMVSSSGKVYAIEANPEVFEVLHDVVTFNKLSNVKLFNIAITPTDGKVFLSKEENGFLGGTVSNDNNTNGYEVEGIRMDNFIKSQQITQIDLLKCNIEGAERFVIGTIGEYINIVKNIAISCHDFRYHESNNEFYKTKKVVTEFLLDNNFTIQSQTGKSSHIMDWVYGKANSV